MSEEINKMLNEMLEEQGKTDKIDTDRLNAVIGKISEIDSKVERGMWTTRLFKVAMNTKLYRDSKKQQMYFFKNLDKSVEDAREKYLDSKIMGGKPETIEPKEQQIKDAEK